MASGGAGNGRCGRDGGRCREGVAEAGRAGHGGVLVWNNRR